MNAVDLAQYLGDAQPARDGVIATLAKATANVREHEHPQWDDLYCFNLVSYMGERMAPALRRLLDAEARIAELEAAPTTVYRAEHPDSGTTLGHYGTAAAAREHCEAMTRREFPDANVDWLEDDEDRIAELTVWIRGEELTTGYIVTALELASAYDEEADE